MRHLCFWILDLLRFIQNRITKFRTLQQMLMAPQLRIACNPETPASTVSPCGTLKSEPERKTEVFKSGYWSELPHFPILALHLPDKRLNSASPQLGNF